MNKKNNTNYKKIFNYRSKNFNITNDNVSNFVAENEKNISQNNEITIFTINLFILNNYMSNFTGNH